MYRALCFVIALFAAGAGPCDLLGQEEQGDGGPDGTCTAMGCTDLLTVEIIRADNGAFVTGAYEFEVVLPDKSELWIECYLSHVEAGLNCSTGDTDKLMPTIDETGETISLMVAGAPEQVNVSVLYSGSEVGSKSMSPSYRDVQPNGAGCPPTCRQAVESMAVAPW